MTLTVVDPTPRCTLVQSVMGAAGVEATCRNLTAGIMPHQTVHYSSTPAGIAASLTIAAGGALVIQDLQEFKVADIRALVWTWTAMDPRVRPALVFGWSSARCRLDEITLRGCSPGDPWGDRVFALLTTLPPIDQHIQLFDHAGEVPPVEVP